MGPVRATLPAQAKNLHIKTTLVQGLNQFVPTAVGFTTVSAVDDHEK